jgi:Asp-tRNA(Asn)/Glu-tRNA(Gln) amidotransferase A subunit family amidase
MTPVIRQTVSEVVFEDALTQARTLDHAYQETGQLKGPLHGVLVTLKDQFKMKGPDTTLGYVGRSFAPATEDAVLVQMLRDMGPIILAKTNLPQSIMVGVPSSLLNNPCELT